MECLVQQFKLDNSPTMVGDAGSVTLDIGQEIKEFVTANPIPSIGISLAVIYLVYSIIKSK